MEGILVPAIVFGSITAIVISLAYFKNRRIERTALIASGKEASIFKEENTKSTIHQTLKFGMLFFGLGIGLLLGDFLVYLFGMNETVAYLSMMFLFGGLGLIIYYVLQKKLNTESVIKEEKKKI
jgi:hypothetical protein